MTHHLDSFITKLSERYAFDEYDQDFIRKGNRVRVLKATPVASSVGPEWTSKDPLPSKQGYNIFVTRNPRVGEDGKPVAGWEHPENHLDGGKGEFELLRNESELQDQLRSYGRYLAAMHQRDVASPKRRRKLGLTGWGSDEHIRNIGGGYVGSDWIHRDPLPSNSYSVRLFRRGPGPKKMTPAELEYAGKLGDYWNYLQSAHDLTSRANRRWNDMLEDKYRNAEVEYKA